jgi:hypothetical protein
LLVTAPDIELITCRKSQGEVSKGAALELLNGDIDEGMKRKRLCCVFERIRGVP